MIISVILGLIVGILMIGFILLIEAVIFLISFIAFENPIIGMVIGGSFLLIILLLKIDDATNSGIASVIQMKHKGAILKLSTSIKKMFFSIISIGSGLPVGREAPAMILGSATAISLSIRNKIEKAELHNAITLGTAAATGALFQAPFGAAIFAVEFPYKEDADEPMIMPAFVASVTGAVTTSTIINQLNGWELFSSLGVELEIFNIVAPILEINFATAIFSIVFGIICGLIGRFFVQTFNFFSNKLSPAKLSFRNLFAGLFICIFVIWLSSFLSSDFYLPLGLTNLNATLDFIDIDNALSNPGIIFLILLGILLQIVATSSLLGAGFQGGIFGPSLRVGILAGAFFAITTGVIFSPLGLIAEVGKPQIIAWAIIGMSSVHAATTKTPIASVIFILEITGFSPLITPIITANVMSYLVSGPSSLYKGQVRDRNEILAKELVSYDQHETFNVSEVMTVRDAVISFKPDDTLDTVEEVIEKLGKRDFPVLVDDKVVGMFFSDILVNLVRTDEEQKVEHYISKEFVSITGDISGKEALEKMVEGDAERAPVVSSDGRLIGIISIGDIIRGNKKLSEI